MPDDSFAWVRDQLTGILGLDATDINKDSRFADDLDADSIDLIEMVNAAEATFGVTIEEDKLYDIETVGDFVRLLDARKPA